MDPNLLQKLLQQMRGQGGQDVSGAPQASAPMQSAPGLDQAYDGTPPAAIQSQPSPFQFNSALENQNQQMNQKLGQDLPVHPIIQQLMQRLGMLSLLRNRANQEIADPLTQG